MGLVAASVARISAELLVSAHAQQEHLGLARVALVARIEAALASACKPERTADTIIEHCLVRVEKVFDHLLAFAAKLVDAYDANKMKLICRYKTRAATILTDRIE